MSASLGPVALKKRRYRRSSRPRGRSANGVFVAKSVAQKNNYPTGVIGKLLCAEYLVFR